MANNVSGALDSLLTTGLTFYAPFADAGSGAVSLVAAGAGDTTPTFTRATDATTVDENGLIVTVSAGTPRSYYDPTTLEYRGYLAEGARTNLLLNSVFAYTSGNQPDAFDVGVNTGSARGPVASTVSTVGQAWECSATTAREWFSQTIALAANTTYTISLYVEAVSGNTQIVSYASSLPAGATTGNITNPSSPGRYSYTVVTAGTSGNATFRFGIGCSANNTGAGSIRFSCINIEVGTFPSTYIPTTASAVTRNADVLTYPFSGNADDTVGTCYAEFSAQNNSSVASQHIVNTSNAAAANAILRTTVSSGNAIVTTNDGTNTTTYATGIAVGTYLNGSTTHKVAASWGGSNMRVTSDGGTPASGVFDGGIQDTLINVGGISGATLFGTLKNVRIWQTQFTAAQLSAITSG